MNHHGANVTLRDVEALSPLAYQVALTWASRLTDEENRRAEEATSR